MTTAAIWLSYLLAVVVLLHGGWWTVLALVALKRPSAPQPREALPFTRFVTVVPAHNEERMVAQTVRSLVAAPYEPRPEVIVVADNCTDATATEARAAGATVLVRTDAQLHGKSFALDYALAHLRQRKAAPDAVIFVDADTTVSASLFVAIASRLHRGADAVQVHYAVAEGDALLLRLRALAFALVHWARPLGAGRLGLGTTLKGNGMALRWEIVRDGFLGAGITEDAAATLALARRGVVVRFEPGATVWGHMAATYAEATVQDRRWEAGRLALMTSAWPLAFTSILRGRFAAASAAVEVGSVPLSSLVAASLASAVLAVAASAPLLLPATAAISLFSYSGLGWVAARIPARNLFALIGAPRFLLFKLRVLGAIVLGRGPAGWQRTSRADLP